MDSAKTSLLHTHHRFTNAGLLKKIDTSNFFADMIPAIRCAKGFAILQNDKPPIFFCRLFLFIIMSQALVMLLSICCVIYPDSEAYRDSLVRLVLCAAHKKCAGLMRRYIWFAFHKPWLAIPFTCP
jgi:hypothetical protein